MPDDITMIFIVVQNTDRYNTEYLHMPLNDTGKH